MTNEENAELKEKQRADGQCEACKLGDLIVENAKLRGKLDKVSKWIKEQECPDGCIDCSAWDTYKLKEILK